MELVHAVWLVAAQRIILSQCVSVEIARQQNAAEIRMTIEDHSEQIECLALMPIGGLPKCRDGRDVRIVLAQKNFQPKSVVMLG